MSLSPVRFAILGFGLHAERRLVPAFRPSENVLLTGLWRRDQAAAQKNCADLAIPQCFASAEELCASPEVDAVFITSPDSMHLEDCLLAIRHGKPVLCEKPLAMNAAEARTIADAAEQAGLLFGVAQNFRFNPSVVWMHDQIVAGAIGTPQLARAEFSYSALDSSRKWITNPSLAAGGPIADVGVHCVDTLRFLLDQDVLSVSALARSDAQAPEVEAVASLQLAMTGQVYATVTTSARSPYRTLLEVTGTHGVLTAENGFSVDRPVDVTLRRAGDLLETRTFDNSPAYTHMLDAFAAALHGGPPFTPTAPSAVQNAATLDAAYASIRGGGCLLVGY